ncbi:MAG: hypothetical protein JO272_15755 [Pseudonocardiales bacterium]|nr:hypothetical protein [Pseudonocardiales bacterium]
MTIIRERVRARGSALDNRAGLVCKAYSADLGAETRALGPAPTASVTHAVVRTTPVPAEADLIKLVARLTARITERCQDERGHLALAGIDPTTWQMVEFTTVSELDAATSYSSAGTPPRQPPERSRWYVRPAHPVRSRAGSVPRCAA